MTITQWNEQAEWKGWSEITTTCECGEWNEEETVFTYRFVGRSIFWYPLCVLCLFRASDNKSRVTKNVFHFT